MALRAAVLALRAVFLRQALDAHASGAAGNEQAVQALPAVLVSGAGARLLAAPFETDLALWAVPVPETGRSPGVLQVLPPAVEGLPSAVPRPRVQPGSTSHGGLVLKTGAEKRQGHGEEDQDRACSNVGTMAGHGSPPGRGRRSD